MNSTSSDRPTLVEAIMKSRMDTDCWRPSRRSGFFSPRSLRDDVLVPDWLIDDGNLVIAVIEHNEPNKANTKQLARGVDKTGRILEAAIADAGLHRLLVVILQADHGSAAHEIHGFLESRGAFRVLTVPSGLEAEEANEFAAMLRPLENEEPFLHPVDEAKDSEAAVSIVCEALEDKSLRSMQSVLSPLVDAIVDDLRSQLDASSAPKEPWSRSLPALDALTNKQYGG